MCEKEKEKESSCNSRQPNKSFRAARQRSAAPKLESRQIIGWFYNNPNEFSRKGLKKITDVPAGARNIRVEEAEPTKSRIVVRTKNTKTVLIDG